MSKLPRLKSALARGLDVGFVPGSIGDRVALTLSSNIGVVVRMGETCGLTSLGAFNEFRLDMLSRELFISVIAGMAVRRSSGICCAVVSSTSILRT